MTKKLRNRLEILRNIYSQRNVTFRKKRYEKILSPIRYELRNRLL